MPWANIGPTLRAYTIHYLPIANLQLPQFAIPRARTYAPGKEGIPDAHCVLTRVLARYVLGSGTSVSVHTMLADVQALLLFGFAHSEDAYALQHREQNEHGHERPSTDGKGASKLRAEAGGSAL